LEAVGDGLLADSKDVSNFFLRVARAVVSPVEEDEELFVVRALDGRDQVDEMTVLWTADLFGDAVPEVSCLDLGFVHLGNFLEPLDDHFVVRLRDLKSATLERFVGFRSHSLGHEPLPLKGSVREVDVAPGAQAVGVVVVPPGAEIATRDDVGALEAFDAPAVPAVADRSDVLREEGVGLDAETGLAGLLLTCQSERRRTRAVGTRSTKSRRSER
jgi:hypothetical protein